MRNELIPTERPAKAAAAPQTPALEAPASGLYLLQFTNRLATVWRDQLRAAGVELLHYVPDDAFVAHVNAARLSTLRRLPFVQWVGPFQAKHKVHPKLAAALTANLRGRVPIKLLARPGATGVELAAVAKTLRGNLRHRKLSAGTFFEGEADAAILLALAKSPAVLWIERSARMKLFDEVATKVVAGETDSPGTFAAVHELGFDGRGVAVAVADSGLDSGDKEDMHPDLLDHVDALFAYGGLPDAGDDHSHGTHVAGIVAAYADTGATDENGFLYGLGVAPGAHIVAQRIFDANGEYVLTDPFEKLTRDAVRSGAYVGSNSWGDDTGGQYDLSAAEFDALVRDADALTPGEQPYVLEFSAGNAGPGSQTVGSPAVAKNVIATGATQNNRFEFPIYGEGQEVMADFSSRGPCEDGRIKPDLVAPGTWIASLRSIFANDENAWAPIDDRYMYQGGTSQSGPHVSGACAVFIQWYRETHGGATPSPALVKAALINSADDMSTAEIPGTGDFFDFDESDFGGDTIVVGDTDPVPNFDEGWGRANLENIIDSVRRFEFADQGIHLATAQTFEKRVIVGNQQQLKVTLVYTDVPALPAAIPALVNDLDLEVVAPNGDLYRGNAFADGESVAGTPVGDNLNNVEAVHLSLPQAGEYLVRVRASNVVKDVHNRATGAPEQDFAVVISGQLPLPGEGVVSWDREAYRAPATAQVRLVDEQLRGQAEVEVQVSSSTQPTGFALKLTKLSDRGDFLGSVEIVTNTPAADGKLHVREADTLTVRYNDADPPGARPATAVIDLQPPAISDVQATSRFGRTTITWLTGEPANSTVFYGTTNAVTSIVTDLGFRVQHSLTLPQLVADTTYFYYVVSADKAGNTSTNDNGGVYYRFVATRPATALLVYAPESLFSEGGILSETPYPGIDYWTGALDQLGIEYEIWDIGERGVGPKADDLKQYRLVLWRPEELAAPTPGITGALTSYVQAGGALFAASFDLPTRLKEATQTSFMSNVLHVASFDEDRGALAIHAVPGEPVGGGLALDLDYSNFPSGDVIDFLGIDWTFGPDHLQSSGDAAPVFLQEVGRVVGLKFPKTGQDSTSGRVVFYSFALEAVPADTAAPNNRATLLGYALEFLVPGLRGLSSVAFDQGAYTVPSSVVVEVTDSRRAGLAFVEASLSVGSNPGRAVRLDETPRKGVFRGRLTLVPLDQPEDPTRFRARHGDTLTVQYVDAVGTASTATAVVDTIAPKITGVEVEPAYNEATVVWETDKDTDATVRFGESPGDDSFLTRSAFTPELSTLHEVLLTGLLPDKDYYFAVVSRDAAGNVTTDSNRGRLYKLRTLKPVTPPWRDNLESGRTGWAVFNEDLFGGGGSVDDEDEGGGYSTIDFTTATWEFGTPYNPQQIAAHSGTNCWATNLRYEPVDLAFTDLVTPAISLVGGNQARLRWWQYYDFSSLGGGGEDDPFGDISIQLGQVALSTDNGATWKDIYALGEETSFGEWEEVEADLSRYVGSVVRIRFNYQLFSFSTVPRIGWFIDDVSVDYNPVAQTLITVSNNLAQAKFTLSGPTNVVASGLVVSTNVPAGDYTITWSPVASYVTPPPQSGTLTSNAPLVFTGTYTFPDANANGISDLWETQHFGSAAPDHTADLDSDGDGASDLQEFLAGTNPKNANSALRLDGPTEQPNRTTLFEWPSTRDRDYVLEVSHDLRDWRPVSDTLRGDGTRLSVTLSALDPRLEYFFRVRVTP
ncbi:MAG: S8 family serine peptidase [Verrucomicrobia bacterium]|nr:S8 family serine peptidase [Verrucomicrobiota bacterium]